jgi:hypothetical protein
MRTLKPWLSQFGVLFFFTTSIGCHAKSSESEITYPSLFYYSSDRENLIYLATGNSTDRSWLAKRRFGGLIKSSWTEGDTHEEGSAGPSAWESARSALMFHKAMVLWMNPHALRPTQLIHDQSLLTYADLLRYAIDNVTGPQGLTRAGANLMTDGQLSKWGRVLEASFSLADYAKGVDVLLVPEVRDAIGEDHIRKLYAALIDGVFHLLVEHLRPSVTGDPTKWNNWTALELAGLGQLALAFREFLQSEPHNSQRYMDYLFATQTIPGLMDKFLETWAAPGAKNYYIEGPHYSTYFGLSVIAYVKAFLRVNGPSRQYPALSLDESQPLVKFVKGQSALLVPVSVKDGIVTWSNIDFDDSWYGDVGPLQVRLAAWAKESNPKLSTYFATVAGYVNGGYDDLTLNTTVEDDVAAARRRLAPLDKVETLTDAVAVARSGSALDGSDLTVALKNTITPSYSSSLPRVPALDSHSHADSGNVAIYRGGEAIALVPGYGEGGYSGKNRRRFYASWLHQNVLELFDPSGGYPESVLQGLDEAPGSDPFVMPWHVPGADTHTSSQELSDSLGKYWVLTTDLTDVDSNPLFTRSVVMDDSKQYVLVIDRLQKPARVRIQWNGNGSIGNHTLAFSSSGDETSATFTGGSAFDSRFSVRSSAQMEISTLDGKFNPAWGDLKHEITTARSTTASSVRYVISLIEMSYKGTPFHLEATPSFDSSGSLASVSIKSDGAVKCSYVIGQHGLISRAAGERT